MAPSASFLPMLRASGMLGQRWHHIALMFSHFRGILWFVLAFVGQELGPHWPYLGPFWAMLGHFGASGYFRICGLCFGLGHFNVIEFSSMQGVLQKTPKIPGKTYNLRTALLMVYASIFFVFVSFLGHAAVRLCLPDLGLMLGHCGLCRHHIGLMLDHFSGILWFVLAFVGQE